MEHAPGLPVEATRSNARLQLRWLDPLRGIDLPKEYTVLKPTLNEGETKVVKPAEFDFPFLIPDGIETEGTSAENLLSMK